MATIAKQGKGYKITVSKGYDVTGKQLRAHMTWAPTPGMTPKQEEKELNRQATLFEERCRNGQVMTSNVRFADFAEKWMEEYAEHQLRAKTVARYKALLTRIIAGLGHIKLNQLQPNHLLTFYDNLAESGVRNDTKYKCTVDFMALLKERELTKAAAAPLFGVSIAVLNSITQGKNITQASAQKISTALDIPQAAIFSPVDEDATLSSKTIMHHHRLISSILTTAVHWQVILSNPCTRVKPPKVEKGAPRYLDEKDAARLIELLGTEHPQNYTMVLLLLMTGFRRGELLGLEWPDIDFKKQVIHVRRSSLYLPDKGVFEDDTKNITSERAIKVPGAALAALESFKGWQIGHIKEMGDLWQNSGRVFTNGYGAPLHPDTLTGWFHDFVAKNGLPQISIHSLRHTNATLQIASGVPLTTVAGRLGHASVATLTRTYAHEIRSADEAAAETLQNILIPDKNRAAKLG